jgi:hypothetical protein
MKSNWFSPPWNRCEYRKNAANLAPSQQIVPITAKNFGAFCESEGSNPPSLSIGTAEHIEKPSFKSCHVLSRILQLQTEVAECL